MIDRLRAFWARPIREEERRPLFLVAAGLVVAIALAIALLRGGGEEAPLPAEPAQAPPALPERAPAPPADERSAAFRAARDEVEAAKRAARRFLAAYLPYSYGSGDSRELRAVATEGLASELAARPPRVPSSVRGLRPRVESLQAEASEGAIDVQARVADGERRYSLALRLVRARGGWRVSGLGG